MQTILVTGGLGYIGSHMVKRLHEDGYDVVVVDNLTQTVPNKVPEDVTVYHTDIRDAEALDKIFADHTIESVIHFASLIQVGESLSEPAAYYDSNVTGTITLLNAMARHHVQYFVFSSSAAIFGNPEYTPIDEQHPIAPLSPYGNSKHVIESMLKDYERAYNLCYGSLRYFNAAGCSPQGDIGELHHPETHLIPLVLQVASGRLNELNVYGNDYDTKDGTCIRDYIHVDDLAQAHMQMLQYLWNGGSKRFFNLGLGNGFSVLEVIKAAEKITGKEIPYKFKERRQGDPAILIADGSRAKKLLNWQPDYPDLETMIKHAWLWEQKLESLLK